jgi:hypothetical protein
MRRLIPVVLCSIALSAFAVESITRLPDPQPIDLDKPGALAALQRDNPKHYAAVMKKVDEVQTVQLSEQGLRNLGIYLLPRPDPSGPMGNLKLSDPAQSRISVFVEGFTYLITVRYTKDPATMVPAR